MCFISNEQPHKLSFKVNFFSNNKSNPERLNSVSLCISTFIFTSPLFIGFITFPFSLNTIISPSSIPFGISTYSVSHSNTLLLFSIIHRSISTGIVVPDNTSLMFTETFLIIGVGSCIA